MARTPRGISSDRAREVADRYFDLDRTSTEPEDEDDELEVTPRRRRRKAVPAKPVREPDPPVNEKQARFIEEYCIDLNGTQAAIRAGYSEKTAGVQAYELLKKPHIQRAIQTRLKLLSEKAEFNALDVLKRLSEELNADLADIFDQATGALKPVHDWPLVWRRGGVLVGVETFEQPGDDEDLPNGRVVKVRLAHRIKHLELVGRHHLVRAWDPKLEPPEKPTTLADELRKMTEGTGLRPREIEGTARPVPSRPAVTTITPRE